MITDRAAIMPAECCTADWRRLSTAVYSYHFLSSFAANKLWWMTYIRMLCCMGNKSTTRGKISLERDIHCCSIFYLFSRPSSLNSEEHVYIRKYLTVYRLYMNYSCYQIAQQWNIFPQLGSSAKCWRGFCHWCWWLGQYLYNPCCNLLIQMSRWDMNQWASPSQYKGQLCCLCNDNWTVCTGFFFSHSLCLCWFVSEQLIHSDKHP
jgi:hypothetical protein